MTCLLKARQDISDAYDLDTEVLEHIYELVVKACEPILSAKAAAAPKKEKKEKKEKIVRPKSAYNMYVKEKFTMAKEAGGSNSQEIMSTVSGQWAKLSAEEKQVYVDQAAAANASLVLPPPKTKEDSSKRRVTGYNLFYRENKDKFKTPAAPVEEGARGESTMKAVGNAWKALSKEEQEVWNVLAKKETDEAAAGQTVAVWLAYHW